MRSTKHIAFQPLSDYAVKLFWPGIRNGATCHEERLRGEQEDRDRTDLDQETKT